MIIMIIVLSIIICIKLSTNALICQYLCLIIANLVMTKSNYDDIIRLLPLTIIVYNKNYTILIIIKESITVNRQNWLIAHPKCTLDTVVIYCYYLYTI